MSDEQTAPLAEFERLLTEAIECREAWDDAAEDLGARNNVTEMARLADSAAWAALRAFVAGLAKDAAAWRAHIDCQPVENPS